MEAFIGGQGSPGSRKPLARSEDLIVEELGGELLVYDSRNDGAHSLGVTAARVWQACDGESTISSLESELGYDSDTVTGALQQLESCGLLEASPGLTRREMHLKVAKVGAAAAAAPFIVSLAIPATAAATPTVEQCRAGFTSGCGSCTLAGCCCCGPGNGNIKDCVPTGQCGVIDFPLAPKATSSCSKTN